MIKEYTGVLPTSFVKEQKAKYVGVVINSTITDNVFIEDTLIKEVNAYANINKVSSSFINLVINDQKSGAADFANYNGFDIVVINYNESIAKLDTHKSMLTICDKIVLFDTAKDELKEVISFANKAKIQSVLYRV